MVRIVGLIVVALALLTPGASAADPIDAQLVQLRSVAAQWWAGYGLTTDTPYAAGGYAIQPGCGNTIRILREHLPVGELGEVAYPHGCDMHISEDLVRAAYGARRSAGVRASIAAAGLRPRARTAAAELLCAVMFHEMGHALGQPHAPTGIMREGAPAPPSACVAWARG